MIVGPPVVSNPPHAAQRRVTRRVLLSASAALLAGCAAMPRVAAERGHPPTLDGAFVMSDGVALPMRAWLPAGEPNAVVLALHGFNDSRDAFELSAPDFAAIGIAFYAPDQRGFGEAAVRGVWAGADQMAADAQAMAELLVRLHPGSKLFLLGESMGGAVLMRLAATRQVAGVAGYVMASPAVWGREQMDLFLRTGLWVVSHAAPGYSVRDGGPVTVRASDNIAALRRLSRDPLTLHDTRLRTLRGLVDLMDDALAAAPAFTAPGLFLYGGHDELVPKPAMRAAWRMLGRHRRVRLAYYPNSYHLLLRDHGRAAPINDILGWMRDPAGMLLSGADRRAADWMAHA